MITKESKEKRIAAAQAELAALREKIIREQNGNIMNEYITQAFELGLIVGMNEAML